MDYRFALDKHKKSVIIRVWITKKQKKAGGKHGL